MNLIEEIEADAKLVQDFHDERKRVNPNDGTWNNCGKEAEAWTLVQYEWWPRIKAALLAAQTNIGGLENREKITVKLDNVRSVGLNLDGSISIYTNEAGGLPRFISIEHALYRLIEKFIDNADAARAKEGE